ncbi:MAG: DNA repair protein RadC [Actinobacteria bacterium]|jgi:DNA repair protein RadC|nr:DNA repair protein RadC [Actinomycetota bacterium]
MSAAVNAAPSGAPARPDTWRDGHPVGEVADAAPCAACTPARFAPGDPGRVVVDGPESAADVLVPAVGFRDRERCVAAFLDTKHRLLGTATVSIGSIDHTFMGPREVFRDALLANASALVLAHNHPSGDPEPSRDDEMVTRRLARAGEMLGIDLLDHLVVGGARWTSLARRGVL